jgi:hypothetical protein
MLKSRINSSAFCLYWTNRKGGDIMGTRRMEVSVAFHNDVLPILSTDLDKENMSKLIINEMIDEVIETGDSRIREISYNGRDFHVGYLFDTFYVMENEEEAKAFIFFKLQEMGRLKVLEAR